MATIKFKITRMAPILSFLDSSASRDQGLARPIAHLCKLNSFTGTQLHPFMYTLSKCVYVVLKQES